MTSSRPPSRDVEGGAGSLLWSHLNLHTRMTPAPLNGMDGDSRRQRVPLLLWTRHMPLGTLPWRGGHSDRGDAHASLTRRAVQLVPEPLDIICAIKDRDVVGAEGAGGSREECRAGGLLGLAVCDADPQTEQISGGGGRKSGGRKSGGEARGQRRVTHRHRACSERRSGTARACSA